MPLALNAASALVRRDGNPYQTDDDLLAYHRDLLAPFGMTVDEKLLSNSPNIEFTELAEGVLGQLPRQIRDPDLLILSYGLPDMNPLKTATAHLNYLLGGRSRSFAVSEQGLRAPFTALRIADAYARSGRCSSLALFICEQTTLSYHDPLVHEPLLTDSSVLLYFDQEAGLQFSTTRATDPEQGLDELLAAMTSDLDRTRILVVAGPWTPPDLAVPPGAHLHRTEAGSYCTSVWLELARHYDAWGSAYEGVVLCDTDPRTGRSQAALLRHSPTRSLP